MMPLFSKFLRVRTFCWRTTKRDTICFKNV